MRRPWPSAGRLWRAKKLCDKIVALLANFFDWLSGKKPPDRATLAVESPLGLVWQQEEPQSRWLHAPDTGNAIVELQGDVCLANPHRIPVHVVQVGLRRAGVIGAASDVLTDFVPVTIPEGQAARLNFFVSTPDHFPMEGDNLLADVLLWDQFGKRQKLRRVTFLVRATDG